MSEQKAFQLSRYLQPAERMMIGVGLFALLVDFGLIAWKGANVDWFGYASLVALATILFGSGVAYRVSERSERIAVALICSSAFIFFSMCLSLFNYLLLPIVRSPIDIHLAAVDAMFGFHWPDVMAMAAEYPLITGAMKFAYMTTMPQIALLVAILGLTGRRFELHFLITSVTITATLTICFWGLFPTLGAKSLYELPVELWAAVNPVVDQVYTEDLKNIAYFGPDIISPKEIRGLIAFPSYHAVLAFTAIYAARTLKYVFPVFLALNMMILPAIFIHGGHHLVDLPAGLAMFLFGTYLARRTVANDYEKRLAMKLISA